MKTAIIFFFAAMLIGAAILLKVSQNQAKECRDQLQTSVGLTDRVLQQTKQCIDGWESCLYPQPPHKEIILN